MYNLKKRANHERSSWWTTGADFKSFAREWKRELAKICKLKGWTQKFSSNHYYLSGFIIDEDDHHIYRSISDVRHFGDRQTHILYRTAEHDKDRTGWSNNYTTLDDMLEDMEHLFTKM